MIRRTAIRPELVFGVLLVFGGAALLASGVLHLLRHDSPSHRHLLASLVGSRWI